MVTVIRIMLVLFPGILSLWGRMIGKSVRSSIRQEHIILNIT